MASQAGENLNSQKNYTRNNGENITYWSEFSILKDPIFRKSMKKNIFFNDPNPGLKRQDLGQRL
jgi:hypothetical protein